MFVQILCFWTFSIVMSLSKNTILSIDWAQLSRFYLKTGDRIQSPKRYVLKNRQDGVCR
jgi:hypothetical protein